MLGSEKIKYFDYFLHTLLDRYQKLNNDIDNNDFSVLKTMKLLFFVTAIDTTTNPSLLDMVFDKFCAMPYGHVESDVYDELKKTGGELILNRINTTRTEKKEENYLSLGLDSSLTALIDRNIDKLVQEYPKLIEMKAFQLVDLSHKWYSWIQAINDAQKKYAMSNPIDRDIIKKEQKIFTLSQF